MITSDQEIIVSDVAVPWESVPLAQHYQGKLLKYSTPKFVKGLRTKYGDTRAITVAPFIIGARGILCSLNRTLNAKLRISKRDLETIVMDTLKGSWMIHADFFRRAWKRIPPPTRTTLRPGPVDPHP